MGPLVLLLLSQEIMVPVPRPVAYSSGSRTSTIRTWPRRAATACGEISR
jgi:hypothetical protein